MKIENITLCFTERGSNSDNIYTKLFLGSQSVNDRRSVINLNIESISRRYEIRVSFRIVINENTQRKRINFMT